MNRLLISAAIAAGLFLSTAAHAQERLGDGALGALAGGLVGGPVGLVADGVIGYTAGPAIAFELGPQRAPALSPRPLSPCPLSPISGAINQLYEASHIRTNARRRSPIWPINVAWVPRSTS